MSYPGYTYVIRKKGRYKETKTIQILYAFSCGVCLLLFESLSLHQLQQNYQKNMQCSLKINLIWLSICQRNKKFVLHSVVSSLLDRSKRFTDLFIATPTRLLRKAYSHAAITARRLFNHMSTAVYRQVLIYKYS